MACPTVTIFTASCILSILACWASPAHAHVLPQPTLQGSRGGVDDDSTFIALLRKLTEPEITASYGGEMEEEESLVPRDSDGKRSVQRDTNLAGTSAAFAVAHDLSGAELAELLRGLQGSSGDGAGLSGIPEGIRCSGVNGSGSRTASSFSPFTSQTCPDDLLARQDNSFPNTRGLCPWTYVENIDENRYPSSMMFAQCACPTCMNQVGDRLVPMTEEGCHPVYYNVRVLRKHGCQGGIQVYESDFERVPVACTCLRPKEG